MLHEDDITDSDAEREDAKVYLSPFPLADALRSEGAFENWDKGKPSNLRLCTSLPMSTSWSIRLLLLSSVPPFLPPHIPSNTHPAPKHPP